MIFKLTLSLNNDEAMQSGWDFILPHYLSQVSANVAEGKTTGVVFDGNGGRIGEYQISDDDENQS